MSVGATFWIVAFALAAGCFFTVAAVVSVKGLRDLRDLLRDKQTSHDPLRKQ